MLDRRSIVLESALETFARYGFRKTSMDLVARDARISRPGLYFLFESKEALFREAVEQSLERDLAAAERALARQDRSLRACLLDAFDQWAGRYLGPLTRDIADVVADNPDLLGPTAAAAPQRFEALVLTAVSRSAGRPRGKRITQTLISTSVGIKHQVDDRQAYLRGMRVAIDLLIPQR